jgi:hypothetical protein
VMASLPVILSRQPGLAISPSKGTKNSVLVENKAPTRGPYPFNNEVNPIHVYQDTPIFEKSWIS